MSKNILEVRQLKKYFPRKIGLFSPVSHLRAVDGVSFNIKKGQTLALVGESGCGKTTTAHLILNLLPATSGKVFFCGRDISDFNREELRAWRGRCQMIFQDPYGSLNPRLTAGAMIAEALLFHRKAQRSNLRQEISRLLRSVGLDAGAAGHYPHQFSGGERQRIGIARALAVSPQLIIADEPVSALDVSIQAQILNLLRDLQESLGLAYLFIAHNLGVVRYISDEVAVMHNGKIVEIAPTEKLFASPSHPYTKSLLASIPRIASKVA